VLALLLLEPNRVVSLDRLAEDVWAGHPPEGWVTTVQIYVSHLRQALEPDRARGAAGEVLVTRNPGYLLRVDREHLDAARFQDGFTAGRPALEAGRFTEAAGTLRQALGLWRSPVLTDLADYAFTRPEAARLEELRLAALEARIDADLALGQHDALTAELEHLAAEHPLRERLHGQLMLALYRCGEHLRQVGGSAGQCGHHSMRRTCPVRSRAACRSGQAASVFAASRAMGPISSSAHTASGGW
jgi:DNA-binding SARP family transcriptional activator